MIKINNICAGAAAALALCASIQNILCVNTEHLIFSLKSICNSGYNDN